MYNIHTHIFNGKYTPEYFLAYKISKPKAKMLRGMLNGNKLQQKIALWLIGQTEFKDKFISFIKIGIHKEQEEVFDILNSPENNPPGARFVVLPLNFEHMGAGDCDIPYSQQMDDIFNQVKRSHPDTCLPFVHIDPRACDTATDLLNFVDDYIERGCVGIKMYPSLGYYPYDPKLEQVYAYAASRHIPVLTHTSRGGIFYIDENLPPHFYNASSFNPQEPRLLAYDPASPSNPLKEPKYSYPAAKNNDEFCDFFLDPENYVDALEKYPGLKICFAHFGSDIEIDKKLGRTGAPARNDTWYDKVISLLTNPKYTDTYADISYTLHLDYFRSLLLRDMEADLAANGTGELDKRLAGRVLYGTDFYMFYQEGNLTEGNVYHDTVTDFTNLQAYPHLDALGKGVLWNMISEQNSKRFLSSEFYKAP
jgi:predicted TIM-barrel fold metal-dependent hydrolase